MNPRVRLLTDDDLEWPWRGTQAQPQYATGSTRTAVDPFPCYAHDTALVTQTLAKVEASLLIEHPPLVWILSHEPHERTNGWAQSETCWNEEADKWERTTGHIVLAGNAFLPTLP